MIIVKWRTKKQTLIKNKSTPFPSRIQPIARGISTYGQIYFGLPLLHHFLPHDAPVPILIHGDVRVLHLPHQEVVPALPPASQALKLCLCKDAQGYQVGMNVLPFISDPGTFGHAWYLREILVSIVQDSSLERGYAHRPRPKLYEK